MTFELELIGSNLNKYEENKYEIITIKLNHINKDKKKNKGRLLTIFEDEGDPKSWWELFQ